MQTTAAPLAAAPQTTPYPFHYIRRKSESIYPGCPAEYEICVQPCNERGEVDQRVCPSNVPVSKAEYDATTVGTIRVVLVSLLEPEVAA